MTIALYVVFFVLSLLHLFACFFRYIRLRYVTKPLLMLTLAFLYLTGAATFRPLVFAGVLMGMLGDTFLLFRHKKRYFALGLLSFAAGHVLYIIALLPLAAKLPAWQFAVLAAVYIAAVIVVAVRLFPHMNHKGLKPGALVYMLLISTMSFAALSVMLTSGTEYGVLMFAGSLCFMVSDSILAFSIFKYKDRPRLNFAVMLTYLAAQFLLVYGFMQV